jgi:uncharacterized membrane protein
MHVLEPSIKLLQYRNQDHGRFRQRATCRLIFTLMSHRLGRSDTHPIFRNERTSEMTTIEHSIEVNVPAQKLFQQLTRFEDYAQFMDNVAQVQQLDATHLRWTTAMANRPVEWDSVVRTQDAQRRISWHDTNGIGNAGKLEVQAVSEGTSRVILALEMESGQFPGAMAGDNDAETSQHLTQSLAKLKSFVEGQGADGGASCGMLQPGNVASPASTSGSPTEVLEDEPTEGGPLRNVGASS